MQGCSINASNSQSEYNISLASPSPFQPPPQLSQHHKHLVSTLEGELAGVRVQLADSTEELQRLKTVLTRASHTIQASLLVRRENISYSGFY